MSFGIGTLGTIPLGSSEVVAAGVAVSVPAGVYVLTGEIPSIAVTDNINVQPGAGIYEFLGIAPTINITGAVNLSVPSGVYSFTGQIPTVLADLWTVQNDNPTTWTIQ